MLESNNQHNDTIGENLRFGFDVIDKRAEVIK